MSCRATRSTTSSLSQERRELRTEAKERKLSASVRDTSESVVIDSTIETYYAEPDSTGVQPVVRTTETRRLRTDGRKVIAESHEVSRDTATSARRQNGYATASETRKHDSRGWTLGLAAIVMACLIITAGIRR